MQSRAPPEREDRLLEHLEGVIGASDKLKQCNREVEQLMKIGI